MKNILLVFLLVFIFSCNQDPMVGDSGLTESQFMDNRVNQYQKDLKQQAAFQKMEEEEAKETELEEKEGAYQDTIYAKKMRSLYVIYRKWIQKHKSFDTSSCEYGVYECNYTDYVLLFNKHTQKYVKVIYRYKEQTHYVYRDATKFKRDLVDSLLLTDVNHK